MNKESMNKSAMNKSMKKQLIATSIMLAIAATPVMASSNDVDTRTNVDVEQSESSGQLIGFSAGAIIGGLIAGPIGIIAAGTVGLIMGQSHERQEQVEIAQSRLESNKMVMQSLKSAKQRLQSRLEENEDAQQRLTAKLALSERTLNQAEKLEQIKLNLRFEIDSSNVESFYKPQIKHLAMMMQDNPELSVNLSGFTDPTGNAENNLKLSQARAENVKSMLVKQGVNEANIFTQAFGESSASQVARTQSSDFNNRRVEVELVPHGKSTVDINHAKNLTDSNQAPILADLH